MTRFDTVEPILTARGVWKHFAGVQALENVELELWPGEVHVLMGSNGSGKSTLCRVIAGAVAPDRGELCLKGKQWNLPIRLQHGALVSQWCIRRQVLLER